MIEMTNQHQFPKEKKDVRDVIVWEENTYSSYYDYKMDTQCYVPAKSAEEILKSLGLKV